MNVRPLVGAKTELASMQRLYETVDPIILRSGGTLSARAPKGTEHHSAAKTHLPEEKPLCALQQLLEGFPEVLSSGELQVDQGPPRLNVLGDRGWLVEGFEGGLW